MLKSFDKFNESKEVKYKLTKDEVDYLWTKIESVKKRKAIELENELFELLNTGKTSFNEDDFIKILNSLEYSFKKKLKSGEITTELGKSIHSKLPSEWVGVTYSVIKAKVERDKKNK